ncbi:MAG: hypothetical protein ACFFB3_02080 [Candidatus Hodarchaeota archaeon]
MLKALEHWPPRNQVVTGIIAATCVFLVVFVMMRVVSEPIEEESSHDVIDLEFAWTSDKMKTILDDWGEDLIEAEIQATYLDFVFLVAYGTVLAGFSLLISRAFKEELLGYLGFRFVIISYIASLFDAIENVNLLLVLYFPDSFPAFAPLLASICATIKFAMILCTAGYILFGSLILGFRKLRKELKSAKN